MIRAMNLPCFDFGFRMIMVASVGSYPKSNQELLHQRKPKPTAAGTFIILIAIIALRQGTFA